MPVITNNLETEQDINNYKDWLSGKNLNAIKRIKRMLEVDKKHIPKNGKTLI